MYRSAPERPDDRSRLWHRPARAAALLYGLGSAAATASIGLFAVYTEQIAARQGAAELAALVLAAALGGLVWGGAMRLSLSLRPLFAVPLMGLLGLGSALPKLFILAIGNMEGVYPSTTPKVGMLIAAAADLILLVSFAPVSTLVREVARGDTEDGPLDVSAAACGWLLGVALVGVAIAPGSALRAASSLMAIAAGVALTHVHRLARGGDDSVADAAREKEASNKAWGLVLKGVRRGTLGVVLGGTFLLAMRLPEQQRTLDPAMRAVYRQRPTFNHCWVKPEAGGQGGIELVKVDCGGGSGPVLGWDTRAELLIEGEALYARAPAARGIAERRVR